MHIERGEMLSVLFPSSSPPPFCIHPLHSQELIFNALALMSGMFFLRQETIIDDMMTVIDIA